MHSFIAEVISDGRITIPKEIRKLLGLELGDLVKVKVELIQRKEALAGSADKEVEVPAE